jgi:hypothetical protein
MSGWDMPLSFALREWTNAMRFPEELFKHNLLVFKELFGNF